MFSTILYCLTVVFLYWLFRYLIIPLFNVVYIFYFAIPRKRAYIDALVRCGNWAVVTGATDGIGKEYCRALAKLGKCIFLLSRDEEKLKVVKQELVDEFRCEVRYLKTDFTSTTIYSEIGVALSGLSVGVLVNNVGMSQSRPQPFTDLKEQEVKFLERIVNCNLLSYLAMTRLVVSRMVANKRGVIINIGSASALAPTPTSALYSTTKTAVAQFSRSLKLELESTGVLVQTVQPFFVQTKFIGKFRPPRLLTPDAFEFVQSAIRTVGAQADTFGTVSHSIQAILANSVPGLIQNYCSAKILRIRANALL